MASLLPRRSVVLIMVTVVLLATSALAGEPEYMRANLKVGQAFEIKGSYSDDAGFVASDLEALPKPRKPKLRGELTSVDRKSRTISMYGVTMEISDKTEFVDDLADGSGFEKLRPGMRVEVSCKVNSKGQWEARRVKTRGVKKSNKVKGTLTHVAVDGKAPDTIGISGLMIILERKTDVTDPTSHLHQMEKEVLGDLSKSSANDLSSGIMIHDAVVLEGEYRHNLRNENQYDLGDERWEGDSDDTEFDIRMGATVFHSRNVRSRARFRLRKRYYLSNDQSRPTQDIQAQFTELYVALRRPGGLKAALLIGRQNFDEPREWLFDEYLDAIRVYYYGLEPFLAEFAVIHALVPMKEKSETWTDIFGRLHYFINADNRLEAYFFKRSDSDDKRNREPVWYGLRYLGDIGSVVRPWVDLALMRGEDKGRKLDAWAYDFGATIGYDNQDWFSPSITASLARASGDETGGDGVDNMFRQTGYQDNVDRLGGLTSVHYYGEILDPEFANIKVTTLGAAIHPYKGSSIEVLYHSLKQDRADTKLKGFELVRPAIGTNGFEDNLGWEVDLYVAFPRIFDRVRAVWVLGFFSPGKAFEGIVFPTMEDAFLNKLKVTVEI